MTGITRAMPIPYPYCQVCKKYVQHFDIEYMLQEGFDRGMPWQQHTGEYVLTVRCHGDTWRHSNWRGRLS